MAQEQAHRLRKAPSDMMRDAWGYPQRLVWKVPNVMVKEL